MLRKNSPEKLLLKLWFILARTIFTVVGRKLERNSVLNFLVGIEKKHIKNEGNLRYVNPNPNSVIQHSKKRFQGVSDPVLAHSIYFSLC